MPIDSGFGALGEFALGEHAFDGGATVPVNVSDGLSAALAATALLTGLIARGDDAAPVLAADADLAALLARGDAVSPQASGAALLQTLIATGDAMEVALADAGDLLAQWIRADALSPALAETATLLSVLVRADAVSVITVEDREIVIALARADNLAAALAAAPAVLSAFASGDALAVLTDESGEQVAAVAPGDTLSVVASDAALLPIIATLMRPDVLHPIVHRLRRDGGFGALGEYALGEHGGDHDPVPPTREISSIYSSLARDDAIAAQLAGTTDVLSVLSVLDAIAVKLAESPGRAEPRLSRRIINIIHY